MFDFKFDLINFRKNANNNDENNNRSEVTVTEETASFTALN